MSLGIDSATKFVDLLNKVEEYSEKKEKRKLRKIIRQLIDEEEYFEGATKGVKEKLVDTIENIYAKNMKRLAPAARFMKEQVK